MRHAKAGPKSTSDRERQLTARGHSDAKAAGAYLAATGVIPDYALVSTATRTVETWKDLVAATGSSVKARFSDAMYEADAWEVLELLGTVSSSAAAAIVIGHNPTMAELVDLLNDGEGDPEIEARLLDGFPTAAVAVFEVRTAWSKLSDHSLRVTRFHVGRG